MTRKKGLKAVLLAGLFLLAAGGWLLHLRIHPITKSLDYSVPFISGAISVFCIPVLFYFRRTIAMAYAANGFLAIIGTITMAQFSIVNFKGPVTAINIILNTTLADIAILWGKFVIGKALFDLEPLRSDTDTAAKGRFFRYPHMGWWWAHLFALAAVYVMGNIFWK